jgi:hypothetical protein
MIYEQIIQNLKEIIGNNKAGENVYKTFAFAEKVINNKEIAFEINPNINPEINKKLASSILGGMYFSKSPSEAICLVFGQKYLDTYKKDSTIHYTILIHEFKHLFDYFQNKSSFFNSNKKEQFYNELEANKIEVEFIKNYLAGKFNLTTCETYILKSFENDNLESWTILNRKESADIYRFIFDLEIKYKQNTISKEQLINYLVKKSDQLLEKSDQFLNIDDIYNTNRNDVFPRYAHYIRIKTFEKYIKFIFNLKTEMTEIITNSPEFMDRINIIHLLLRKHDEANHLYSSLSEKYMETYFVT